MKKPVRRTGRDVRRSVYANGSVAHPLDVRIAPALEAVGMMRVVAANDLHGSQRNGDGKATSIARSSGTGRKASFAHEWSRMCRPAVSTIGMAFNCIP